MRAQSLSYASDRNYAASSTMRGKCFEPALPDSLDHLLVAFVEKGGKKGGGKRERKYIGLSLIHI